MEISETSESGGGGLERVREAAERARRDLLQQLAEEAERLDRELGQQSERAMEDARQLAEDRLEREVDRLQQASSNLSLELHRQLHEGSERYRTLLAQQLEASGAALREEVIAVLESHRVESERRIDGRLEALERTLSERSAASQTELSDVHAELGRLAGEIRTAAGRAQAPVPEPPTGGGERLDQLLARLQTADQRLRDSDDRTRQALRRLRGPE